MNEYTIVLPIPDKILSPNARPHYMALANAKRKARTMAYYIALSVIGSSRPGWKTANVQVIYFFKDKRKHDRDNYLSILKSYFDGLTDSGLITDDAGFTHLPMVMNVDPKNPRVEITITKTCTIQS